MKRSRPSQKILKSLLMGHDTQGSLRPYQHFRALVILEILLTWAGNEEMLGRRLRWSHGEKATWHLSFLTRSLLSRVNTVFPETECSRLENGKLIFSDIELDFGVNSISYKASSNSDFKWLWLHWESRYRLSVQTVLGSNKQGRTLVQSISNLAPACVALVRDPLDPWMLYWMSGSYLEMSEKTALIEGLSIRDLGSSTYLYHTVAYFHS